MKVHGAFGFEVHGPLGLKSLGVYLGPERAYLLRAPYDDFLYISP